MFRIDDVLQNLAAELRGLAREKNLELHCVGSRAWVHSDPNLLRRILQNFLSNAVRYTGKGRVLLGCRRHAGQLRIQVLDTGIGIDEADHELIFEEFRRLDRSGQGLGLGLSIAERMARLLGHRIGFHSRPGKGTAFWIDVERATVLAESGETPVPLEPQTPRGRVLVVDDDVAVRDSMRLILETWGCEVETDGFC